MKIQKFILITGLILSFSANAQNWNVFNTAYRYNYKYNYSLLVSQVMFADSSRSMVSYSVNYLNRIGVECMGTCPTITTALNQTLAIIVPNMPQFLQRKIINYNSGYVVLRDTAKLVLIPHCLPGQTWLFDSINNKNATCINKTAQTIFGLPDSVKLIIVDGTDTLRLSKNFGILQFPALYNKNKYYRLAGIENAATYDQQALYGEKVPNAWDFYNFDIGDRFCYRNSTEYLMNYGYRFSVSGDFSILSKTVTSTGYQYGVNDVWVPCSGAVNQNSNSATSGSITTRNYLNLSSTIIPTNNPYPDLLSPANQMYPGQIVVAQSYNIVHFATDAQGRFYKFAGLGCASTQAFGQVPFPLISYTTPCGYHTTSGYLQEQTQPDELFSLIYGVGLGLVARKSWSELMGELVENTIDCAVKSGTLYLGNANYVGIKEQHLNAEEIKFYPNPVRNTLHVTVGDVVANRLVISNILGETVFEINEPVQNKTTELSLTEQQQGIYLVQVFNNSTLIYTKKVIKN